MAAREDSGTVGAVEVWRSIPDIPHHEVSSLGRIRSLPRTVPVGPGGSFGAGQKRLSGRIRKLVRNARTGYDTFTARVGDSVRTFTVHGLVARTFHGNPPGPVGTRRGQYCVNHKNGRKDDNRPENLEWVTVSANAKHAKSLELYRQGEAHYQAKVTEGDVRDIRWRFAVTNVSVQSLADEYGLSYVSVHSIIHLRTWKSVP